MQRPTGVTILAIVLFLGVPNLFLLAILPFGGGSFLGGFPILLMSLVNAFVDWPSHLAQVFSLRLVSNPPALAAFCCFLGLVHLALGVGLLRLQNWARVVTVILSGLNLVAGVVGYASPRLILFRQSIITLAIEVVVVIYLFQPPVKEAFGASKS